MKEVTPSTVPDSLLGEIRALVRLYRGEPVLEDDAPGSPETVVVLGTQVLPGGRPSRTLRARALHAARLYAGGEVALLIPTGSVGKHPPSEAEVAARILREAGVPDEVVLIEEEARSTRESARLVAAMAEERGIQGVVLVTDPLHCVRAIEAFRTEDLKTRASPVYSSPMWRSTRMRRGQLLREIGALLWYRLRRGSAKQRAGSR
ncbi:MAG: YdcF family protein [Actinomycetota bacterium]|nr:YdcF family protein [Actinomycetota bacterium]